MLILMRWLSRVYYGTEMTPLELELRWTVERVIGVPPEFYEHVLMVDADTCVDGKAINGLISFMVDDAKVCRCSIASFRTISTNPLISSLLPVNQLQILGRVRPGLAFWSRSLDPMRRGFGGFR